MSTGRHTRRTDGLDRLRPAPMLRCMMVNENIKNFQAKVESDITTNYTEILLYEDAFETSTDLVELVHKFIM